MKVVLAEKPSVARELASYLGANSRKDGFLEGSDHQVTWALGHLVCLKEPADYDPALKKWSLDTLPFVPRVFALKLRDDKLVRQQFSVVQRLFRSADQIICATDAGREGELIFRYIFDLTGCTQKPAWRLWLSSLTPQAIRSAFQSMRPLADYDNLFAAAKCRSEADWIVGLNATRNYTVRYAASGILWSLGRVQTPVLAMIVRRDDDIRTFTPQPFWELMTHYRNATFRYSGDRFDKQAGAQALLDRVLGQPFVIQKTDRRPKESQPPQLYDLTELQRDMNRRFGMSAANTLNSAQSLYESKLISYPRTDSRYLTADMKTQVPGILRQLGKLNSNEVGKLNLNSLAFSQRIVNDSKVTDHHAIIPTGTMPGSLLGRDQRVYDAIVIRMIAAFYPACIEEVTVVDGLSNELPFRARGVRLVEPGWTELYPRKSASPNNKDDQPLADFSSGESGPHKPSIKQGETSPPKHFTENTLLGAMETAGKLVDEAELREALKEKGLGTAATRASIIETLLKREYITREKKSLFATDTGRYLIAIVRDPQLKSPELTGEWEAKLKRIEAGQFASGRFMQEIADYTQRLVRTDEQLPVDADKFGNCPKCGQPIIQGKRGLGCSAWRDGCKFVLWPTYRGHELSMFQMRELLLFGVTLQPFAFEGNQVLLTLADSGSLTTVPLPKPAEGRRKKSSARTRTPRKGSSSASAKATTDGKRSSLIEAETRLGTCPLCGADVIEQKKSYSCRDWRSGCGFAIWKTMSGKRISARTAKTLLRDGATSVLKGFKSKSKQPFDARLKLQDGKVSFDFEGQ
jgi:DNA topoisomerase III